MPKQRPYRHSSIYMLLTREQRLALATLYVQLPKEPERRTRIVR